MQGIGKVLNTLYDQDESLCAVSCITAEKCISYNMLSMTDGKHCQFLETINSTKANVNSTMYGKYTILFIVLFKVFVLKHLFITIIIYIYNIHVYTPHHQNRNHQPV